MEQNPRNTQSSWESVESSRIMSATQSAKKPASCRMLSAARLAIGWKKMNKQFGTKQGEAYSTQCLAHVNILTRFSNNESNSRPVEMWYVTMFTVAPWDGFHPGSKTITNNHRQDCRVTHWVDCECDYQTANGMSPIRSRWPFAGHTLENSSHCPGTSAQAVDSPGLAIDHTMISWFPWASCFFMFFPWSFPSTNDEKKYHTWSQIGPIRDHADKIKLGSRFWWVFHSTRANRLRILVEKQELEALEIQYANMTM